MHLVQTFPPGRNGLWQGLALFCSTLLKKAMANEVLAQKVRLLEVMRVKSDLGGGFDIARAVIDEEHGIGISVHAVQRQSEYGRIRFDHADLPGYDNVVEPGKEFVLTQGDLKFVRSPIGQRTYADLSRLQIREDLYRAFNYAWHQIQIAMMPGPDEVAMFREPFTDRGGNLFKRGTGIVLDPPLPGTNDLMKMGALDGVGNQFLEQDVGVPVDQDIADIKQDN